MTELELSVKEYLPEFQFIDNFKYELSEYINHLIIKDFQKLVYILYRMDISEQKLQSLLDHNTENTAGDIIAEMIIERQQQKIESRKKFTSPKGDCSEEAW